MHLVDTTMFLAPESGGVGRYLGVKHAWLARHTSTRHTIVAPGAESLGSSGGIIQIKSRIACFSNGFRFPLGLRTWQKRLVELAPDVLEVGDPFAPAWAALGAGQKLGAPVIGFYHSDLPRAGALRLGGWVEPVLSRYVRRLYREFDLVIAPSLHVKRKLEALGLTRVTCRPLGVDLEVFHPRHRDETLRRTLGVGEKTRLLIFAGRFAAEKNLPLLERALRQLGDDYHLLLVGSGPAARPQRNVTLLPFQHDPIALARLLSSADAFVHAGDQETFGLVVLEAMACGIPVIAADRGAVSELVSERNGIVVRAGSIAALAEGIDALYRQDVRALGTRARQTVQASYSWDVVMRALLRIYLGLAASAAPVPQGALAAD